MVEGSAGGEWERSGRGSLKRKREEVMVWHEVACVRRKLFLRSILPTFSDEDEEGRTEGKVSLEMAISLPVCLLSQTSTKLKLFRIFS